MTKKVRYKAHFQFYYSYEGEKCGYNTFLDRTIRQHTPMEEAIKPQQHIKKKKSPIKQFWEASVFRKAYARMLSELEDELVSCENPSNIVLLNARLSQLKEEIRIFNLYN